MDKYEKARQIELEEGFDASAAEEALRNFMENKLGGFGVELFESAAPGVIAFERLSLDDEDKVDYDELADKLGVAMCIEVVAISDCDWSFDDKCDEEATYVAFDIPSLDESYRQTYRNELSKGL